MYLWVYCIKRLQFGIGNKKKTNKRNRVGTIRIYACGDTSNSGTVARQVYELCVSEARSLIPWIGVVHNKCFNLKRKSYFPKRLKRNALIYSTLGMIKCNLCGNEDVKIKYSLELCKIYMCPNCNLVFTDQGSLKYKQGKEMYSADYFQITHPNFFRESGIDY